MGQLELHPPSLLDVASRTCDAHGSRNVNSNARRLLQDWLHRAGSVARRNWATFDEHGMWAGVMLLAIAVALTFAGGCSTLHRLVRVSWPVGTAAPEFQPAQASCWYRARVAVYTSPLRRSKAQAALAGAALGVLPLIVM